MLSLIHNNDCLALRLAFEKMDFDSINSTLSQLEMLGAEKLIVALRSNNDECLKKIIAEPQLNFIAKRLLEFLFQKEVNPTELTWLKPYWNELILISTTNLRFLNNTNNDIFINIIDILLDEKIILSCTDQIRFTLLNSLKLRYYNLLNSSLPADRFNNNITKLRRSITSPKKLALNLPANSIPSDEFIRNWFFPNDQHLFNNRDKEYVLRETIVMLTTSLFNIPLCIPYLQYLNNELIRYFKETHNKKFPTIKSKLFAYQAIDGLMYPVPVKKGYRKLRKRSALPNLLTLIMNQHGIAQRSAKWIGFVETSVANQNIMDGFFITESKKSYTGLFHGKLSHMIQITLMILILEKNKDKLHYQTPNGSEGYISIQDVLSALVTRQTPDGGSLWATMIDMYFDTYGYFGQPHFLHSFIMCHGHEHGLTALQTYLTDSFLAGFDSLLSSNKLWNDMTPSQLAADLNELSIAAFDNSLLNIKDEVESDQKKGRALLFWNQNGYGAVVKKNREPNPKFNLK